MTAHSRSHPREIPPQVWAILTDLNAYPRWHPFIISSQGRLRAGSTLTNQMRDSTGITTFTPVVLAVRPDRELRWIGQIGPGGIFDGEYTFVIQPLGPGRIRFTQREQFTGVASRSMSTGCMPTPCRSSGR